ncbi:LpxL/LpxP family Kdo(2)-lipid IV(A) lauroyl/palmitoleoyl acyltransferase [Steroidobacter cummioxidans]|uniref:LpxL/LpxP family Kdo(2)-lipid IV(A) lauroyl/palmitoleoyl acyltransferase n=1 Tax=Steroidobacter cummioxidans TaxID=1803913 RepID=UPI000E3230EA|nr:LpxL/LpxP family Kdo(2)-lipid IV(A) lauroyl/palmitoleoyl acyltransferase [Steroidobacter cummioxidans]
MKTLLPLLRPHYWPTWLAIGTLKALQPLPVPVLTVLGRALGSIIVRLPISFVRIARTNIGICLPELSDQQRDLLLKEHFKSLGLGIFETATAWWGSKRRIARLTDLEGLEHLQAAMERGRGVILLSAHFTTLEIGGRVLCEQLAGEINIMYRPTANAVLERFLAQNRSDRTKRAIPRDDIRTLIAALRANEPVWYAPDQAYRKKGAEMVPFFGIPAATNTATSRLARMTGAAVLPFFQERLPSGRYRMVIQPMLENFPSDDPIADAKRFNELIEAQVRRVPEQYLWIHRRFKGLTPDYPDYYKRKR